MVSWSSPTPSLLRIPWISRGWSPAPYHGSRAMTRSPSPLAWTLCDPMNYTVHRILQARILQWVAFPFFRGSSQPRDRTQVSCIAGKFFTSWATREALEGILGEIKGGCFTWLFTKKGAYSQRGNRDLWAQGKSSLNVYTGEKWCSWRWCRRGCWWGEMSYT